MRGKIVIGLVGILLLYVAIVGAQTNTSLNVQNSAPVLLSPIPDLFLVTNAPSMNVLDLDDYFEDYNGDAISFTYTSLNNITVFIDSENRISFFPDTGYEGIQFMTIYANDSEFSTASNQFIVTVGSDTIAPQWSNPSKNRVNVYQSSNLTFSTIWTDNVRLERYLFSINQGSGWVNYSSVNFSGTTNSSTYNLQISATAGTTVYWRFYAWDWLLNLNATDIQNFSVAQFAVGQEPPSSPSTSGGAQYIAPGPGLTSPPAFFTIDKDTLHVSLRQGDRLTQVIKIKNVYDLPLSFNASITGVSYLTEIGDPYFTIEPGEEKDLLIDFIIPKNTMPDQYFGMLYLDSLKRATVPIVIEVREFNSLVNLNLEVLPEYKYVKGGKPVVARISITHMADYRESSPQLYYAIKDYLGNIYEFAEETINLTSRYEVLKNLTVPQEILKGEYLFYARVYSDEYVDLGSDKFTVGSKFALSILLKSFLYPILFLLLFLLILILYFIYKNNQKKKKLLELYLLLNEVRSLVKEGKMEDALSVYKRIKLTYGQHISKDFLKDKELLKEELNKFSKLLSNLGDAEQKTLLESSKKEAPSEPKKEVEPIKSTSTEKKEEVNSDEKINK